MPGELDMMQNRISLIPGMTSSEIGQQYYPHFLRLNRITEICSNPEANIEMIKSFTGIRSIRVIEGYMGTSKKEQKAAMDFMAKQIKENQ